MNLEKEILYLTDIYMRLVCCGHHKDCDCHWYINKVYSYGETPYYNIEHYGYIFDKYKTPHFEDLESAQMCLIRVIKSAINYIEQGAINIVNNKGQFDKIDLKEAKKQLKIIKGMK